MVELPMHGDFHPPPPPPDAFTFWHLLALVGAVLLFYLLLVLIAMWFKDRKSRRLHEEQMLALERGLVPAEGIGQPERDARQKTWLWLAVGLPVFIALALGAGTYLLVDGSARSGRDATALLIVIWLVGGAVGLAAVIVGGLGLMAAQRAQHRRASGIELPRVEPASRRTFDDRDAG